MRAGEPGRVRAGLVRVVSVGTAGGIVSYDLALVGVIAEEAASLRLPGDLLTCLAWGESGLQQAPPPGDQGRAFGPFQVRVDVHGGPGATWEGLDGARASMHLMGWRWARAFERCGGQADWDANCAWFLYHFWPDAQGASQPTLARCMEAVREGLAAWDAYQESRESVSVTVEPPPISQVPGSPANCYPDRHGILPEAIVLHIMEGTLAGCDSWFANPDAQAGAHFGIGRDGAIHQYYRLDQAPFANGAVEPGATARLVKDNAGINPNYWTVSLEHEGHSGDAFTPAQFEASTRLAAWLWQTAIAPHAATTGATLDRDHVLRHGEISPKSRAGCPGWPESELRRYVERVRALVSGVAPTPEPEPPPPVTMEGIKLGLIDKILRDDWAALARDVAKIVKG